MSAEDHEFSIAFRDQAIAEYRAEIEQLRAKYDDLRHALDLCATDKANLQVRLDQTLDHRDLIKTERDAARKQAETLAALCDEFGNETERLRVEKQQQAANISDLVHKLDEVVTREQRLSRLLAEHHAVGALDRVLIGDECPICARVPE